MKATFFFGVWWRENQQSHKQHNTNEGDESNSRRKWKQNSCCLQHTHDTAITFTSSLEHSFYYYKGWGACVRIWFFFSNEVCKMDLSPQSRAYLSISLFLFPFLFSTDTQTLTIFLIQLKIVATKENFSVMNCYLFRHGCSI